MSSLEADSDSRVEKKRVSKRRSSKARPASKRWSDPEGFRFSVSPTVCSVNPGRELELRTTLGISRLRSYIWDPSSLKEAETFAARKLPINGSYFVQNRWRLKAGRLQPLGLHTDPGLSSQACLGVVSVGSPKKQHLRSLTAPLSRTATKQGHRQWDSLHSKLLSNRRINSAFPYSTTPCSGPLWEVDTLVVTKNESEHSNSHRVDDTKNKDVRMMQGSGLSSSVPESENESGEAIIKRPSEKEVLAITAPTTCNMDKIPTVLLNLEPMGNRTLPLQHTSAKRRIRRPNGSSSARLSHGWTDPRPLLPVTGSQPPTTSVQGSAKQESGKRQTKKEETALTTHSSINVDVSKVLNGKECLELTES